jgi:hypothetical protein
MSLPSVGCNYKTASNLAPLNCKVGSYANSRVKLYGKEIVIGVASLLLILALVAATVVFIYKALRKSAKNVKSVVKSDLEERPAVSTSNGKMFAVVALTGFVVSLLMAVYTVLVVILGMVISRSIDYSLQNPVGIVLVIISFFIYILLVMVPGILIGVKKGVGWGLGTVTATILWLIFWVTVIFLVLFLFGRGSSIYPIFGLKTPPPIAY